MVFNNKKILHFIAAIAVLFIVFEAGVFVGKSQIVCKVCKPENIDFSLFWEAYQKISENFIDAGKIDEQKAIYGAISGMAKSLGDPYTEFFSPEQAKTFREDLAGAFNGIGVEIGIKNRRLIIIAPLKDTPGEKAGLKPGDEILEIDGQSAIDISIDKAVSLIRGKKGTKVVLTVMREGWDKPKDFTIVRDTIKIPSMDWEVKDGKTAYVRIYQFDQSLSGNFREAAFSILNSGADRIVLDMRNNPGGYLEVSKDIAGWFFKPGEVVAIEDLGAAKERLEHIADGSGSFSNWPIVVLINEGTASASEILAGSLRDNKNVLLVGKKSFGKGSIQDIFDLQDKSSFLKITTAKWLTPKGHSISEEGLNPDVEIGIIDDDVESDRDPQLDEALEIIRKLN